MQRLRVALDWTPNTIHSGLYVALEKGFYSARNLDVELLPPDADYSTTPAKRVEGGSADLAICPSDSCIAYNESGKMKLQAVYAILQTNASAIVSTKPELSRPRTLVGCKYGSYNARYEDDIVRRMISEDGEPGEKLDIESEGGKLSLFDEVKKGNIDATWVFLPWEGVEAELEGIKMNTMRLEDYGIPYGYSPVIARNALATVVGGQALESFVNATRAGYQYALDHPEEAAKLTGKHCQPPRSDEFLIRSQTDVNKYTSDGSLLGSMSRKNWQDWLGWLRKNNLLKKDIAIQDVCCADFVV